MVANFVKKEDEDDLSGHGTHCAATRKHPWRSSVPSISLLLKRFRS